MDALEQLNSEFLERFQRREIFCLSNIALENTYIQIGGEQRIAVPRDDLEEHLSLYKKSFREEDILIGPALNSDDTPSGMQNYIGIYVTIEGLRSSYHQKQITRPSSDQAPDQID